MWQEHRLSFGEGVNADLKGQFDPRFNLWEWRIQRMGWVLIALFLLAALVGLFGGGVLSNATARDEGDGYELALGYPRFGRAESTLQLDLQVTAPGQSADEVSAKLSGQFVEKVTITSISPEPDSSAAEGDTVVYTWQVEEWSEPLVVRFEYESRDWRMLSGTFEVDAGSEPLGQVAFEQFLFP